MESKITELDPLFSMDAERFLSAVLITTSTHKNIYYSPKVSDYKPGVFWPYRTLEATRLCIRHGTSNESVDYLVLSARFITSLKQNPICGSDDQNAPAASIYLTDEGALRLARLLDVFFPKLIERAYNLVITLAWLYGTHGKELQAV